MKNIAVVVLLPFCIFIAAHANAIGSDEAEKTATQFLQAYQSKNWVDLATFIPGSNAQTFESDESMTSGWRWQAASNWNGAISGVRYSSYDAANGTKEHTAYAKFGESGDECFIVTMNLSKGKWYVEDIHSPDCSEFYSYSRTSDIVTPMPAEENARRTKSGNAKDKSIDTEVPIDEPERDAYQQYIAAYNKLTQLMSEGKGDTPQAKAAFKAYKLEKEKYENFLKENKPKKSRPEEKSNETKVENSSGNTGSSMQEAYKKYIAAYKKLTLMVVEMPILDPPEVKKASDEYHQYLTEYNSTGDRRAYQGYIAAHNRLTSMAIKVKFTSPPALVAVQDDYYRTRAEYEAWIKK